MYLGVFIYVVVFLKKPNAFDFRRYLPSRFSGFPWFLQMTSTLKKLNAQQAKKMMNLDKSDPQLQQNIGKTLMANISQETRFHLDDHNYCYTISLLGCRMLNTVMCVI